MELDRLDLSALVILLAAGLVAYVMWGQPSPNHAQATPTIAPCAGILDAANRTECFAQRAATAGLQSCADAPLPDACAGLYAEGQGMQNCDEWPDADACRYFASSARLRHANVTIAEGLASCRALVNATWRYACLQRHVQVLDDAAFCLDMEIDYYRAQCLEQVKAAG